MAGPKNSLFSGKSIWMGGPDALTSAFLLKGLVIMLLTFALGYIRRKLFAGRYAALLTQ